MTNKEFVNYIAPIIKRIGNDKGYKIVSTTIAQAIIEGGYGKSSLAAKYHNHFGMKCGKGYKGKGVNLKTKEEYTVGTLTTITDAFRVYDNDEEGIKGYYSFISAKRYQNLKTAKNYKEFAEMLKADGYATSKQYVDTLCSCVKTWNLEQYDTDAVNVSTPAKQSRKTIGIGATGDDVAYLHKQLKKMKFGYVDLNGNVYTQNTANCIMYIQKLNNLVVDGKCNSEVWGIIEKI